MKQFKGFKPEAMQRIAGTLGYQGDMGGFNNYLNQNPNKMQQMNMYEQKAMKMVNGGAVKKYLKGGLENQSTEALDPVSRLLVDKYGWTDLGDGTVTNPEKTVIQSFTKNTEAESGYDVSSKPYVDPVSTSTQGSGPTVGTGIGAGQTDEEYQDNVSLITALSDQGFFGGAIGGATGTSNTGNRFVGQQQGLGGPLAKGYYAGPSDGVYKYGEGPYAAETQAVLDAEGVTFDEYTGKGRKVFTTADQVPIYGIDGTIVGYGASATSERIMSPQGYELKEGYKLAGKQYDSYEALKAAADNFGSGDGSRGMYGFDAGTGTYYVDRKGYTNYSDYLKAKTANETGVPVDTIDLMQDTASTVQPDGFDELTNAYYFKGQRFNDKDSYVAAGGPMLVSSATVGGGAPIYNALQNASDLTKYQDAVNTAVGGGETTYRLQGQLDSTLVDKPLEIATELTDYTGATGTGATGTGATDTGVTDTGATGTGATGTGATDTGVTGTGQDTELFGISLPPQAEVDRSKSITELQADRAVQPGLPYGTTVQPVGTAITTNQLIPETSGQVGPDIPLTVTQVGTAQATTPTTLPAQQMTTDTVAAKTAEALKDVAPAQAVVDPRSMVYSQRLDQSKVSALDPADQGTSIDVVRADPRMIQLAEQVNPVANAQAAAKFTEEAEITKAATATPSEKATVQGQLAELMQDFVGGNTPAWAAGAMRNATTKMAARGLGASSMAAQAIVQAAMESALPIAQADASVIASFEAQNLSNRQQRAMLAAEQRAAFIGIEFDQAFQSRVINASKVSDIANMNFTADQQVALENSRSANTVNLANLSNKQALIMAEAGALANLDMANLSNRQQAEVMNAQTFLQTDMANLSNKQQTEMFKAQSNIQALFSDQAAENASRQFNATSQNQTDQFFANLQSQASQFNTAQANAQAQFNAGEQNVMEKFSAEMMNQRDQFNAQNRLVIDQQNAQWRRQVATADTVAINRANEINATNLLNISNNAYNDLWAYYQDTMEYAWNSTENERERLSKITLQKMAVDANVASAQYEADMTSSAAWGSLVATTFTTAIGGDTLLGKGLKLITG